MNATIDLMKQHESKMPSRFQENAEWRRENREWLKWGKVNFSFKSIAEIENKLSIKLIRIMEPA